MNFIQHYQKWFFSCKENIWNVAPHDYQERNTQNITHPHMIVRHIIQKRSLQVRAKHINSWKRNHQVNQKCHKQSCQNSFRSIWSALSLQALVSRKQINLKRIWVQIHRNTRYCVAIYFKVPVLAQVPSIWVVFSTLNADVHHHKDRKNANCSE